MSKWSELDEFVSEYLLFKNCKQSHELFTTEKDYFKSPTSIEEQKLVISRIVSAVVNGEYTTALTLWDTYVISSSQNQEADSAEFIMNLFCAIYPFRSDVIKSAGNPKIASKVAARQMTIFKHYIESKGYDLVQQDSAFASYRGLPKIAFPPTHPAFKHLFTQEWMRNAILKISQFLDKYFQSTVEPQLCKIYKHSNNNINNNEEIKLNMALRKKSEKTLKYSSSLCDLTNQLMEQLDDGNTPNQDFLNAFRVNFEMLREVIQNPNISPKRGDKNNNIIPDIKFKSPSSKPLLNADGSGLLITPRTTPVRNSNNEYDIKAKDLSSICLHLQKILDSLRTGEKRFVIEDALQAHEVAINGSLLIRDVIDLILGHDQDNQANTAKDYIGSELIRVDILGLVNFTSGCSFISSLAQTLQQLPYNSKKNPSFIEERDDDDSFSSFEKVLASCEILTEYLCRLAICIASTTVGAKYLSSRASTNFSGGLIDILSSLLSNSKPYPSTNTPRSSNIEDEYEDDFENDGNDYKPIEVIESRSGTNICTSCLMTLALMSSYNKNCQIYMIKKDCMGIISRLFNNFYNTKKNNNNNNKQISSSLQLTYSLLLIELSLENVESIRYLVSSSTKMKETENFIKLILNLVISSDDNREYFENMHSTQAVNILKKFFNEEKELRQAAKETNSVEKLREYELIKFDKNMNKEAHGYGDEEKEGISLEVASQLVDLITADIDNNPIEKQEHAPINLEPYIDEIKSWVSQHTSFLDDEEYNR
jgi:hypothetical protein